MKRQKRDRLERARARGYQAGVVGKQKEACPYQCLDARGHWLGGWRDAGVWGAMEPKTNVSSEPHRKGAFRSPAHPPGITL
ncbi:ribosome modulation factor [Aeromonas caviae]|nr:ribosome modulation factor [Aeromonas caviae]UJQ39068.1 ribosome modulation factor [Aeromonas caviae]